LQCLPNNPSKCYDFISAVDTSWEACRDKANSYAQDNNISGRSWMATINSQEENDFLCNFPGRPVSTTQDRYIYLGGNRLNFPRDEHHFQWTEGPDGNVDAGTGLSHDIACGNIDPNLYCNWAEV